MTDINTTSPDAIASSSSDYNDTNFPVQVYYIELTKMYMNRVRWHWHPEIEIIIMNHGEAEILTDDQQIRLRAGQGILLNQNIMHSIQPVNDQPNCTMYSVVFNPTFLLDNAESFLSEKYLSPVINSASLRAVELYEGDTWQEQVLDVTNSIIATNLVKKYGYELTIKSYLCQLWNLLLEKVVPQSTSHRKTPDKQHTISLDETRVKSAILYIQEHFHEQITLEELAASIHLSKSECCRCFKRTLQTTPIEFLMKYRILQATTLLQQNAPEAQSMSVLAFSIGFNNASYFNKVFRQYLGCTPSEYKKQIKNDPTKKAGPFQELKL